MQRSLDAFFKAPGAAKQAPAAPAGGEPEPKRRKPADDATLPAPAGASQPGGAAGRASLSTEATPSPVEAGAAAPGKLAVKKKAKRAAGSGAGKAGKSEVEGVGKGLLEAAKEQADFDPAAKATWQPGEPVPYGFLADTFESISETTKRLEITRHLTEAYRTVIATTPEDLLPAVYLSINAVAPAYSGIEMGIGDATIIKALAQATGKSPQVIKEDYKGQGDLGIVAMSARTSQKMLFKPKPLALRNVFKQFKEISMIEGNKSAEKKVGIMQKLIIASQGNEPGYLVRSLQGKLRIGLAEQTVLTALAHAVLMETEEIEAGGLADRMELAARVVKQVYSECPVYDQIVPALIQHGVDALPERCKFTPGIPVKPMLAKPTTGVQEVLEKFSDCEFTCEYKYDGERAQIHVLEDGAVKIYSRNSEDNTTKYPDIVELMKGAVKEGVTSIVLDCEAVAYDRTEGKILPFQVLSTRSRKGVKTEDIKVQVVVFAFDCLHLNGETLLQRDMTARREALYSSCVETEGTFQFAKAKTSKDVEELQVFLDDSIADGTEGLIVKTMDATYEPSKRSLNWLKLKKDYMEGVGDSLDLTVIGAWHGKGKRTGVYGAFLLASYNDESEEFETITKIGTGFSEEGLEAHFKALDGHVIDGPRQYYKWNERLEPDVWFEPALVWEVKAADLSISPVHLSAAGLVDSEKGIALRFPRYLRTREDKTPETGTSSRQVAEMYNDQDLKQDKAAGDGEE